MPIVAKIETMLHAASASSTNRSRRLPDFARTHPGRESFASGEAAAAGTAASIDQVPSAASSFSIVMPICEPPSNIEPLFLSARRFLVSS
jgi:hypothetical protein